MSSPASHGSAVSVTASTSPEAKEGLEVQPENQTLASITFQNLFRLYPKLAGMTGTAMTEAGEFSKSITLKWLPFQPTIPSPVLITMMRFTAHLPSVTVPLSTRSGLP